MKTLRRIAITLLFLAFGVVLGIVALDIGVSTVSWHNFRNDRLSALIFLLGMGPAVLIPIPVGSAWWPAKLIAPPFTWAVIGFFLATATEKRSGKRAHGANDQDSVL